MTTNNVTWKRLPGGYLRSDGEWFLVRGARMSDGNGTAWLIHQRVTGDRIGRDSLSAYDTRNGFVPWRIEDGYPASTSPTTTADLYAHDLDAGSLAEAKYTVAVVEREAAAACVRAK
jgi:hypothetical protein